MAIKPAKHRFTTYLFMPWKAKAEFGKNSLHYHFFNALLCSSTAALLMLISAAMTVRGKDWQITVCVIAAAVCIYTACEAWWKWHKAAFADRHDSEA